MKFSATYKCLKCGFTWIQKPAIVPCRQCGHKYISWLNYGETFGQPENKKKKAKKKFKR